jgi:lipopolysaccharide transport system ATP-binding protein
MSSEIAVKVDGLSKCYQIYHNPRDRLKQFLLPKAQRVFAREPKQYFSEFWALNDVSFEVRKGETVGIIGRNGSGKSTLLQLVCGTLNPTAGTIQANGRIAALLELGSGFNPEFTGRENVYLNAALLGLSEQEINTRLDSILAFADIGKFIDQPVKTYSSGMMVRLAFAVQAQVDPDILIVDEALAVGDAKFQVKCFERLNQLKNNGASILLVTHSSEQIVTHCNYAILLEKGRVIQEGEPRSAVNTYLDLLFGKERKTKSVTSDEPDQPIAANAAMVSLTEDVFSSRPGYNKHEYRWGDGNATLLDFLLQTENDDYPTAIHSGQQTTLTFSIKFHDNILRPIFGLTVKTKEGVTVYGASTESLKKQDIIPQCKHGNVIIVRFEFNCNLAAGDYFLSVGVASAHEGEIIPHDRRYDSIHFQVRPNDTFHGLVNLGLHIDIEECN